MQRVIYYRDMRKAIESAKQEDGQAISNALELAKASSTENGLGGDMREDAYWERPCAAKGLTSYRYKGRYGWIMIGAGDRAEALREAARSTDNVLPENLQVWNGKEYANL